MNNIFKNWITKNGLSLLGLALTTVATVVNNKNNEKTLNETVTKRVNEVLADKMRES